MEIFFAIFMWPALCTDEMVNVPTYQFVGSYDSVDMAVDGIRDNLVIRTKDGVPIDCRMEDAKFFIQSWVAI